MKKRSGLYPHLVVDGSGRKVISGAGGVLLTRTATAVGLDSASSAALARRRGSVAGVMEQVEFLTAPVSGQSDDDIALDRDLRAVALMNLGIIEAWASATPDAERHLLEGAALARANDRPYLEVACVAQVAFASRIHPLGVTRRRCQQAMALAERYGWDQEPIVAPALIMLAATMVWTGDFEQADRCLQRTERALRSDAGPGIRLLLHVGTGMLHGGRGRLLDAVAEFGAAEDLRSRLEGSHALANQVTAGCWPRRPGWGGPVKPGLLWHHSMPIGRARESSATPGR